MENPMDGPGASTASPGESVRRVAGAAQDALHATKDAAKQRLERESEKVVGSVQTAASSLRRAADDVDGEHAWISTLLRKSADGLEGASHSLSGGDVNRALTQLNSFARQQPAVFLGASVALGFVLARIGKTAVENGRGESTAGSAPQPLYPTPGM